MKDMGNDLIGKIEELQSSGRRTQHGLCSYPDSSDYVVVVNKSAMCMMLYCMSARRPQGDHLLEYPYYLKMSLRPTSRHLSPIWSAGETPVTFNDLPMLLAPLEILWSGTEEGHEASLASLDHGI